ncbi:MAG: Hsp33 family molecular chaperone [Bauldia sp.]|nr:MAG: Hsp33 family molecular chaperone [Bauldia sp.]
MTVAVAGAGPSIAPPGDDGVRPFEVAALDVRGRAIQMGPAVDAILSRHDYPAPVAELLGEAIVLAVLLGSSLKFDGKFILQTETDGPVDMLVVDYATTGAIRAYARFDAERVAAASAAGAAEPGALLGRGTLAMTIDQGVHMNRYQGVVPLEGESLEAVAHTYFRQSEQIPTRVRLAVGEMHRREGGVMRHAWRAGGLLVQFLPEAPGRMRQPDLPGGDLPEGVAVADFSEDDAWVEAQSLVGTIEDHELTDPAVPVDTLLYRLFHERGVRVFAAAPVRDQCSCSRERVSAMLAAFSAEEIAASTEDGRISVTCEFCGTRYGFDPAEFAAEDPAA